MAFKFVIQTTTVSISLSPRAGMTIRAPVKIPVSKYPFLNVPFFVRARSQRGTYSSSALPRKI